MPGMDGTGPLGNGPTGRGMGPCGGGRGGMGRGGRAGWGRRSGPGWGLSSLTPDEEKTILSRQKSWLESQVEAISQKLAEFDND